MVRVITQETYDDVVKENIEEFDMSPEEAVKEAVAQFEAQGVDLSNIIKDLALSSDDNHLVSITVEKLKELCSKNGVDSQIIHELDVLKAECNKDIAHRVRAGKEGAYNTLIDLLEIKLKAYKQEHNAHNQNIVVKILSSLRALMEMQPDVLDERGVNIIKSVLEGIEDESILLSTLQWTSVCCVKHEMNRQMLFNKNITDNLKKLLERKENKRILSELLQVIRRFTLDDDIRVEFGKAHEHARDLGVNLLEILTKLLKENTQPPIVSELMLTMSTLLVRHELCAQAYEDVLYTILADNYDNVVVVLQASKLITALAGNDDVKRQLVKSGIVPIIVSLLKRHSNNATAASLILKCISALSLRETEHGKLFLENGVAEIIVECLTVHEDNASVQKNGCWAIRNMVARHKEHNPKFHELGIEAVLNKSYAKYAKDFGFDIKSALRDLDCDVKFDEQWTGKGVQINK
ncbi:armadillo repeat-containing protein 6 homolog isoform X1 [Bicyclus anynana]|uniref:Armadillo repeat-containing protein 6 homolog isoform X1 n=1 Tax=Bicyclus anynana TaxID=110368 RepID=A0A6J1NKH8_BICAN|nr:armadillo repeat-containing protein 6 homolog isoform X1 [Bicyclus anynana]